MSVKNINADELRQMIDSGNAEIIDIREPREYDIVHLKDSKLISMLDIENRVDDIDWSKNVVLICRSGGRSRFVAEQLSVIGKDVYNLEHGLLECYQGNNKEDLEIQHSAIDNYFI